MSDANCGCSMNCTQLISHAFALASLHGAATNARWIRAAIQLGSRLPDSLLMMSIQRLGRLDLLLRLMEDEFKPPAADASHIELMAGDVMSSMAELWVGSAYEIFRLSVERDIQFADDDFGLIAHQLKLIRIPLEKHEIASGPLPGGRLELRRSPPNNDATDIYIYEKNSRTRAHIMPSGISERGSLTWQVIDLKAGSSFWLERRSLADRILDVLAPEVVNEAAEL